MGQHWQFFNLSRQQYIMVNGYFKLGCIFFVPQPFLIRSLAIPYSVPELAGYLANPPPLGPVAKKGLMSLPDDLLFDILMRDDLSFFSSVCLAVTCKKFLTIASQRLLTHDRDVLAAGWAHCRIMCLGEYTRINTMPEALVRPTRKARMRKALEERADLDGPIDELSYAGLDELCVDAERGGMRLGAHQYTHFAMTLPPADRRLFVAAAGVTFPDRDDWVLCNTVKCEYVRASALAALGGCPDDASPFLSRSGVDFGTALFTRFCFSVSNDTALANESVNIHEGKWAGDRFVIDTIERAVRDDTEHEWKDVTDEVVEDIKAIYRDDNDPEDWEKRIATRQWGSSEYFQWDDEATLKELLRAISPEELRWRKRLLEKYA